MKGNDHFKVCEYARAIECYSECINKILSEGEAINENNRKLLALVYSNRAMAYIKTNERSKALNDCTSSISYDTQYAKTYLRRADCYRKLGQYK
jgi:tetratricopeptide (TPR) repeat protein